jgi:hypothetical protein
MRVRKLTWFCGVTLGVLLLLVILFWSQRQAKDGIADRSFSSSQGGTPASATPASSVRDPIKLLLQTPAGQISGTDAATYLALIKKVGPDVQAEIQTLCHSVDIKERVVGTFLRLETTDNLHKTVQELSADHLPYVSAEVGRWLFLNQHFDEWQKFIKIKASNLSSSDYDALLSPFDMTTPGLQLAAGPTILGVGKDYADFTREVIRNNPGLSAEVQKQILSPTTGYNRQQALISLLQTADFPACQTTLLNLKAQINPNSAMYSRLTWLAQQQPTTQSQIDKLTETVATSTLQVNGRPDPQTASAIKAIAAASRYSENLTLNKAALEKGVAILDSITPQDYSVKKTREELQYVLFSH